MPGIPDETQDFIKKNTCDPIAMWLQKYSE